MRLDFDYLIVGGGMTADSAVRGIREIDQIGSIGLVGAEPVSPYDRPPLSKSLWRGKIPSSIFRHTEELGIELRLGRRVVALEPQAKIAKDDHSDFYSYRKLLIATGGTPKRLSSETGSRVIYYRTFADYERLRALTETGNRFCVIGGGFIGSEIAAALSMNNKEVTMLISGTGIGSRIFPEDLCEFLNDEYRRRGVRVLTLTSASRIEERGGKVGIVALGEDGERRIEADGVIIGIGIVPNVELAVQAGARIENGIMVDEMLRTSVEDIYAAGDVASFYNPALNKRLRFEHEDNANHMGRAAGKSMAAAGEPYYHLPFFYSDLFEFGYEAVGELGRYETFMDWVEPFKKGVIYYRVENRVRGVLLWNVWNQVDAARDLIATPEPLGPDNLRGRLR